MFAPEDVVDIYRLIPPSAAPDGQVAVLPSLLLSSSGRGFLTSGHVSGEFENFVTREPGRIGVASLSRQLDIELEFLLRLVRASPSLALVSEDGQAIVAKQERDAIESRLYSTIAKQLVARTTFLRDNDISSESLDFLLQHSSSNVDHRDIFEADEHIISKVYCDTLLKTIKECLENALGSSENAEFSSMTLPGSPPTWYIGQLLDKCLSIEGLADQFHVEKSPESIRCVPRQSVLRNRDSSVEDLRLGQKPCIDISEFAKEFRELHGSEREARDYFATLSGVGVCGPIAVSEKWLHDLGDECASSLEQDGVVDISVSLMPHSAIFNMMANNVSRARLAITPEGPQPKIHRFDNFVLTPPRYASELDKLFGIAKGLARSQWQQLRDNPDHDLKYNVAEISKFISNDQPIQHAIVQERAPSQKRIEEQFWNEVADLESQNEAELSTFWVERVLSRMHNYTNGLDGVEDTKLRDQLADLLAAYFQKELVPDTVSKARSQGLVRSRKARKNVQKLETAFKTGKLDVAAAVALVEKFNKKQGIQELGEAVLVEAKSALISDLVRRMQKKQADGPLLFLTLVIILLARSSTGVVYASGKFAPKLMKQLKASLSAEEYEQLEKWKELAKAGTLELDDKEKMRSMAADKS
ncbi:hypothetical protein BS50DRAFT_488037 [Corynespora cassiicola Philippines]|uniref:Uncharacterized protein n=1 Tax=Corynespora cassiicola Philippines TaxID=1448308 RepID=A0A2T2NYI3_CORCC|nr:hypothetical protein BS50DRAFT_488037 [Corynespora cassiicola Philippines]